MRKTLTYNIAQLTFDRAMNRYKKIYNEWGRGTGKTTIMGRALQRMVHEMPRASINLIGESYQQMLTRTLPSMIMGLEQHGLIQGVHYFIGRTAPKSWNWPKAYQPPQDYSRYIHFYTGTGVHLISQDKAGDGRGLNVDAELGDEAALLSKDKLDENTSPALRGSNVSAFEKCPLFMSSIFSSSTPLTLEGKWFTDMEDLSYLYPNEMRFIKADYTINAHNLGKGFIENARMTTLPYIFEAEYLNVRPNTTKNSFYSLLKESTHTYAGRFNYSHYTSTTSTIDCRGDEDCYTTLPLTIGLDFGATINCLTVVQHLKSINELRALKSMYVLGDNAEMQDDLADKFIAYYKYHSAKTVYMWYDNTGNNKTGNTRLTKSEQFADRLRLSGWTVVMMTEGGANPAHDLKHRLWEMMLKGDHPSLPRFTMNKTNCRELYISMTNAKAIHHNLTGQTQKDKSSERSKRIPRQLATDLSDSVDSIVIGMFGHMIYWSSGSLPI